MQRSSTILPVVVLDHLVAGDEVRRAQPDLAAGRQAEELLGRVLHEVVALDPELAGERHLARPGRLVLRVVGDLHLLDLALGVVLDDDLEGVEHAEAAKRRAVEHVAHRVLEHLDLDHAVGARDADLGAKSRMPSAG